MSRYHTIRDRLLVMGPAVVLGMFAAITSSGQTNSDVADAVMRGERSEFAALLDQGAQVNTPQVDGATAIHWAVYHDDLASARRLIGAGANVDVANREGRTPLAMAALYGNAPMIRTLLDGGADALQRGPYGQTMLMLASRNGNTNAIRLLLDAGVDVNTIEDLRGTTALMWAVEQGHARALDTLIDGGADVSTRSGGAGLPRPYMAGIVASFTPFDVQGQRLAQDPDAPATLGRANDSGLGIGPINQAPGGDGRGGRGGRGSRGAGAGRGAAGPPQPRGGPAGADAEVRIAGAQGAGGGGLTPLAFAARQGDIESARVLLRRDADVNQVTTFGWSPLLVATQNRHYQLAQFLIDQGADVNLANNHGWTPLYLATDNRNIEGGDYPAPKADMDHLDYIRLLISRGVDVNQRVYEGTPRSHTTLTRTIFTMQWFLEEGATPFVRAAQSNDLTLMRLLLEEGADPTIATSFGDTALTAAAGIGWVDGVTHEWSPEQSLEVVRLLLELGLDPNHTNGDFRTPLMAAALKGRSDVIRLLLDSGARLDTRDNGSRDTHNVDLSGQGGWQAVDYADGLIRVGVQSAVDRPEAAALLREMMTNAGLPVPPRNRTLDEYICAIEGPLCQNPETGSVQ